jgi:hypothetical protein
MGCVKGWVMLERQMEEAVASCPGLFIEPGLTLLRRQVVINGRRPDVLFSDSLSRHLLVEIQYGRLDEDHLQRHFYYYFDYRAKYPSTHLRLMFIANRLVPQHKQSLDEHGYEFREYPEQEFERRVMDCQVRSNQVCVEDLGLLLCASKDDEVIEYTLSRSLSPAMIAEYQTQLPDKRMLAARLREFYLQQAGEGNGV